MVSPGDGWVIVSGAGGALGSAVARHYAAKGRPVLALDRELTKLAAEKAENGIVVREVDILSTDAVRGALAETDRIGLLINAVGLIWNEPVLAFRGGRFATHDYDTWRRVIDANLTAAFIAATETAARMARRGGGAIVNFSSISSGGNVGQAAYSAAKAGVEGFTRAMAAELGPLGIRVNAIAPGFIDVATTRGALSEKQLGDLTERTPVRRLGLLEDVVAAVEFLEANTFINGEILRVDGGLRL